MKHLTVKEKETGGFEKMKSIFHYKNVMAMPRMQKVVLNVGTGTMIKKDKNKNDAIADRLAKITGQKPAKRGAKKSIASFKLRQGDQIGVMVTLRGKRMMDFFEKLTRIVLPRLRDFRGVSRTQFDTQGNYTLGLSEYIVFPEIDPGKVERVQGVQITIVTTAKSNEHGIKLLEELGMPFTKA